MNKHLKSQTITTKFYRSGSTRRSQRSEIFGVGYGAKSMVKHQFSIPQKGIDLVN